MTARNVLSFFRLDSMNVDSRYTNINALLFLFAAVLVFGSCNKNKTDELWAAEEAKLAEWMGEHKPHLKPINNGIYFEKTGTNFDNNQSPDPVARDNVLVDFVRRYMYDDTVEGVSYKEWWDYGAESPSTFREGGPELWFYERWISKGIDQLREEEKATVWVPSRLLGLVDFRTRVYTIHLRKVISPDLKAYQEKLMGNFMANYCNAVDTITVIDRGKEYYVMYHIEKEGDGEEIDPLNTARLETLTSEYYFMEDNDFRICSSNVAKLGFNNDVSKYSRNLSEIFINDPEKNNIPVKKGGVIVAVMPYVIMYDDKLNMYADQYIAPLNSVLMYRITIKE